MKRKFLATLLGGGMLFLGLLAVDTMLIGAYKGQPNLLVLRSPERVFSDALFINSVAAAYSQETKSFYVLSAVRKEITVYNQAHKLSRGVVPSIQTPDALAVDSQGRIYIADSTSNQLEILGPTGQLLRSFRVPKPASLAVLSDGTIVVASPVGGRLLHTYDLSGRRLGSFGEVVRFDVADHAQNRFLNRGKVLVGPSDTIYYVFQYAPLPTVRQFSKEGKLLSEFVVEGYAVDLQAEMAHRFLDTKSPNQVGGITVITSATVDPTTGHLWISMNGSSKSGVVYEYDSNGGKLREYAFVLKSTSRIIIGVKDIIVKAPSIYIFADSGAYRFDWNDSLPGGSVVLQQQDKCPAAEDWPECGSNCGTANTQDDKDCKAVLQSQVNTSPPNRIIGSSCTHDSTKCQASVTTCNTQTGDQVMHSTTVNCQTGSGGEECDPVAEENCYNSSCGTWNSVYCTCDFGPGECGSEQAGCNCSPVLVDVLGNGFELINALGGVNFDLNGNGHAGRLSWTAGGVDDAFLVFDRNGNGRIDNGTELFGNYTSQPSSSTPNGFLALAEYDKPENGGNRDGKINSADAIYSSLRLWQDANHDGISNPSELFTLPSLGVAAIDLDYRESRRRDRWGNEFRYRAKVYGANGQHLGRWAYDVFLISQP
jgi:hypothetical protein